MCPRRGKRGASPPLLLAAAAARLDGAVRRGGAGTCTKAAGRLSCVLDTPGQALQSAACTAQRSWRTSGRLGKRAAAHSSLSPAVDANVHVNTMGKSRDARGSNSKLRNGLRASALSPNYRVASDQRSVHLQNTIFARYHICNRSQGDQQIQFVHTPPACQAVPTQTKTRLPLFQGRICRRHDKLIHSRKSRHPPWNQRLVIPKAHKNGTLVDNQCGCAYKR